MWDLSLADVLSDASTFVGGAASPSYSFSAERPTASLCHNYNDDAGTRPDQGHPIYPILPDISPAEVAQDMRLDRSYHLKSFLYRSLHHRFRYGDSMARRVVPGSCGVGPYVHIFRFFDTHGCCGYVGRLVSPDPPNFSGLHPGNVHGEKTWCRRCLHDGWNVGVHPTERQKAMVNTLI